MANTDRAYFIDPQRDLLLVPHPDAAHPLGDLTIGPAKPNAAGDGFTFAVTLAHRPRVKVVAPERVWRIDP